MIPDRSLRPTLIVVAGTVLVAGIGFFSSYLASRFENARLITNLQIQREQAESSLRSAVFNQIISTFLTKSDQPDLSKSLLRLELLAQNFGDTVSLTPLFKEFRRDLNKEQPAESTDRERIAIYHQRLRSLAKRVASQQFSSLSAHGEERGAIRVDLSVEGTGFANGFDQFVWPRDQATREFGISVRDLEARDSEKAASLRSNTEQVKDALQRMAELGCMTLNGVTRKVVITVSSPSALDVTVNVQLRIWDKSNSTLCSYVQDDDDDEAIVKRDFALDFFNFPKIDNTRLTNNQRFALVMESYDQEVGIIGLAAVIFPSEYASLSERPGMKEAVKIMQDAMDAE